MDLTSADWRGLAVCRRNRANRRRDIAHDDSINRHRTGGRDDAEAALTAAEAGAVRWRRTPHTGE
jgi:hypothetical protein